MTSAGLSERLFSCVGTRGPTSRGLSAQRPRKLRVSPVMQTLASLKTKDLHARRILPNLTHAKIKSEEVSIAERDCPLFTKQTTAN